ncbi:MBL fold metallo-hydrolase RNA specificity domain-containing protein [Methanothrix sp.]
MELLEGYRLAYDPPRPGSPNRHRCRPISGWRYRSEPGWLIKRKESTILCVGYQAEGTLGRRMLDGIKSVQIMNHEFDVRARIESMDAFSAHAGKSEILEWLRAFRSFPGQVFLNHGEDRASEALAEAIRSEFGARVSIAKMNQSFSL